MDPGLGGGLRRGAIPFWIRHCGAVIGFARRERAAPASAHHRCQRQRAIPGVDARPAARAHLVALHAKRDLQWRARTATSTASAATTRTAAAAVDWPRPSTDWNSE